MRAAASLLLVLALGGLPACGTFASTFDIDFYRFEVEEEAWVNVRVDAFALGSRADVTVALSSPDNDTEVAVAAALACALFCAASSGVYLFNDLLDREPVDLTAEHEGHVTQQIAAHLSLVAVLVVGLRRDLVARDRE